MIILSNNMPKQKLTAKSSPEKNLWQYMANTSNIPALMVLADRDFVGSFY